MRKRNSYVMLWLTDRERQMLNEKSGKAGMSTQRFLRKLISDCQIHEAPPAAVLSAANLKKAKIYDIISQ